MMLFYSEIKKIKYFLPPPQKRHRDMNSRDRATHMCLFIPAVYDLNSRLSDSAQSNPFIKNYYLIIVAFSSPHFSIYDIFSTNCPIKIKANMK